MGKNNKRIMSMVLALLLTLTMVTFPSRQVAANQVPGLGMEKVTACFPTGTTGHIIPLVNVKSGAVVSIKSSNTKVAKVIYKKNESMVKLVAKKPGSAVISCTVKQDGETYKSSMLFKVLKYKNPLVQFKIGKTDYASKYNNKETHSEKKSITKQKVQIKLKKGYTLDSLYTYTNSAGSSRGHKNISNGSVITLKKGDSVNFGVKDSKGNVLTMHFNVY